MKTSASKKEYEQLERRLDMDRINVEAMLGADESYCCRMVADCAKRWYECSEELKKKCSDMHVSTLYACAESNLWLAVKNLKELEG